MIQDSLTRIWLLSKKNITLYIKKGPVLIFGLMFPFFMTLSWVIGRKISLNLVFIGIIAMTSFFTATAISPVVLPIETREKSLERILSSPISLNEILIGIILASTLYSLFITSIITIIFVLIFSVGFNSLITIFLMFFGIGLMSILGSLLGLLVAANPTDMTSDVMIIMNLIKFPLLFISGIFVPLQMMPFNLVFISFLSPITFLTDLLRFCVEGNNFFLVQFDILMLIFWIISLSIVNYILHKKTMPKRLSETASKKKMMMKKNMR
ncbi:MAG: ABC transporter [Promethearchaeota archaeon Loki_b32]|nr:MAG: ABC transporter [Candidatus Lokiarchaeota archaeon Loki_b32]